MQPLNKDMRRTRLLVMFGLFFFFMVVLNIHSSMNYIESNKKINDTGEKDDIINTIEKSGYWNETFIHIDNNWSVTETNKAWCNGSGTWSNPYIIENVTVDNLNQGNVILIENSNDYFIITSDTAPIDITEEEKKELAETEAEIDLEKREFICLVHKGPTRGAVYICPKCDSIYCVKCASVIKEKGEKCWSSCEYEIEL